MRSKSKKSAYSLNKKGLKIIKEWGGVATVLIAILYTFPFNVIDRFVNRNENELNSAREALTEISALQAEKIINTAKINDLDIDNLSNTYYVRILHPKSKQRSVREGCRQINLQ